MAKKKSNRIISILVLITSLAALTIITKLFISKQITNLYSKASVSKDYTIAFAPKGTPADNWNTAEKLLKDLIVRGKKPISIERYNGQEFVIYTYLGSYEGEDYFKGENFLINPGEGYHIRFENSPGIGIVNQFNDYQDIYNQAYYLNTGWQLISFPDKVLSNLKSFKARDLCREIDSQGGEGISMIKQKNSPSTGVPENINYNCDSGSGENFVIGSGDVIFAETNVSSVLNLP